MLDRLGLEVRVRPYQSDFLLFLRSYLLGTLLLKVNLAEFLLLELLVEGCPRHTSLGRRQFEINGVRGLLAGSNLEGLSLTKIASDRCRFEDLQVLLVVFLANHLLEQLLLICASFIGSHFEGNESCQLLGSRNF